jgi:hypothetical protein
MKKTGATREPAEIAENYLNFFCVISAGSLVAPLFFHVIFQRELLQVSSKLKFLLHNTFLFRYAVVNFFSN